MKVGVVGCGYWGPNFVRNFSKASRCTMAAVADSNPARLDYMRSTFPNLEIVKDAQDLIVRPDLDAIVVATPVRSHYDLAKMALLHGKHVLVSKPMTQSSVHAEELLLLARQKERILLVDHTFLYSGPVRKIRQLIDKHELGDIYYYDSVRVNLGLFQTDVNVLWDLAAHDFSIMLYLINSKPMSVSAVGASPINYSSQNFESVAFITIRFDNKAIAHFTVSWLSPIKVRRTLISCSRKMVVYDHLDPDNQVKIYDKAIELSNAEEQYKALVQYRIGDMHAPKVDQTEALELECQHFVDCCLGLSQPLTDAQSGMEVVRLLESAQRSMDHNGEVIHLGR